MIRVRFAPSPTGHLHVGNARTALFNWLLARHHQGTFILRVEDTDRERSTAASEAAIKDDLRWLGLGWDEGVDVGGDVGPYRQSERLALYEQHTERLLDGGHAYYCFCSPETLEAERQAALAAGQPPKYSGRCRSIALADARARRQAGERPAVRLRVPAGREVAFDDLVRGRVAFHTEVIGDPVIVRGDGVAAYNYAVVIDDALMRITHVVRGEDHISNTPRQILVYEAFGWSPPAFAHLSLVLGPDHAPLSKRHGATSVAEFRDQGLPARGAGQLPGADRLVARRRRRGAAARRTGPPVRPRRRGPQRRRLRRSQAGLGQPALPQAGRSGSAGGAVPAVSRAATASPPPTCHRPRRRGCAPCCRRWPRRSTGSTSCPSG